jgi:tol-pal system protein YbgF
MFKVLAALFPILFLFGCVTQPASQSDVDYLKKEVSKLQIKFKTLEAKQAEMYSKYEENLVDTDVSSASIQELYKKTSKIAQDLKDLEVVVKNQKSSSDSSKSMQLPSQMYENAYNDFLLGKYEVAIVGFKSLLKQYKDHDLAEQAQYYIGESLYSQTKYSEAYEEYKKVEENYSSSKLIPASRLKMALCLELLNKKNDAVIILQTILTDYPKTAEAFTAKEKIKIYTNDKSK